MPIRRFVGGSLFAVHFQTLNQAIMLSQKTKGKKMADCPVCGARVETDSTVVQGELLECGDCGSELEITGTDPVTLEEAPEAEEDWGQ